MKRVKKLLGTVSVIIIISMMLSVSGFALENINFSREIAIATDYVDGEVLIVTSDSGNDETINTLNNKYDFTSYSLLLSYTMPNGYVRSIYEANVESIENMASYCYRLGREGGVISAEPNYIGTLTGGETPPSQSVEYESTYSSWYLNKMGNEEMKKYLADNNIEPRPVKIAVIDSGADYENEAIRDNITSFTVDGNVYHGYNTVKNENKYDITDNIGHGTDVISTIVSKDFFGRDVGINPYVEIVPIKALSNSQVEYKNGEILDDFKAMMSSVISALGLMVGRTQKIHDVDIVSMSVGFAVNIENGITTESISTLESAINLVENCGILMIASAGNKGSYIYDISNELAYENGESNTIEYNSPNYPAAYENVIGVMGYDNNGKIWEGSDFGIAKHRTPDDVLGYDVIAPASNIFALHKSPLTSVSSYHYTEGTSFAAPLTAGVIAYYLALLPESHFAGKTFSEKKAEVISVFQNIMYHPKTHNNILDMLIPTVSLIDVIKAVDSTYSVPKNNNENIGFNFTDNSDGSKSLTVNCGTSQMPDFDSVYNTPWYGNSIKNVTSVTVVGENVTKIGDYSFSDFVSLESVVLPSSVTEIGTAAFMNCINLNSVQYLNSENEYSDIFSLLKVFGADAFGFCKKLTFVNLSNAEHIGGFAFEFNNELSSVTFPQNGTAISEAAFIECSNLNIADLSGCGDIGEYAFYNSRLMQLKLPSKYNAIIKKFAFSNIPHLSGDVALGSNITEIESYAFYMSKAERVISLNSSMVFNSNVFCHIENTNVVIYGYSGSSAQSYVADTNESFVSFALLPDISAVENSTCVIDRENKIIYGLCTRLTRASLRLFIEMSGGEGTYDVESNGYGMRYIGTGHKINLKLPDGTKTETYTVLIFGDLNGDGIIDASDVAVLSHILANKITRDEIYMLAGDVVNYGDGITQEDVDCLSLVTMGKATLSQVPGN